MFGIDGSQSCEYCGDPFKIGDIVVAITGGIWGRDGIEPDAQPYMSIYHSPKEEGWDCWEEANNDDSAIKVLPS